MPKKVGMNYLKADCAGYTSAQQRSEMWERAHARLGEPMPTAGQPELLGFDDDHQDYFNTVVQDPQFARTVVGFRSASFVRAEIDPCLAIQFHISTERAAEADRVPKGDSMQSLLELCLPAKPMKIIAQWAPHPSNSAVGGRVVLTTDSLNLNAIGGTEIPADGCVAADGPIGPILGAGSDLVQVVRFGGRCYLRNGYHRAWSIRRTGQTHMPCLFLEADDFAQVVANPAFYFPLALLQSADPPAVAHFTQARAVPVNLRRVTRRATITWSLDFVRERP